MTQLDVRKSLQEMLENQANLNASAYSTTWLEKGWTGEWDYNLAASQEIAEFINSYWQPWWSKSEKDMANCRIEIVDALHFMLSEALISLGTDTEKVSAKLAETYDTAKQQSDSDIPFFPLDIARSLQSSLNGTNGGWGRRDFEYLFWLCLSIDFTFEQLYALYFGKSVLNKFRQDKGYKQGLYKKKWDGVHEDNYFLSEWIVTQTSPTVDEIYAFLEEGYTQHCTEKK